MGQYWSFLDVIIIIVIYTIIPLIINVILGMMNPLKLKKSTTNFQPKGFLKITTLTMILFFLSFAGVMIFGIVVIVGQDSGDLIWVQSNFVYALMITCALFFILDILVIRTRGGNVFSNVSKDYSILYNENRIPILGKCKICGRPIPAFYGKKNIRAPNLSRESICFQADGQHLVYLQKQNNPLLLNEAIKIYKSLKKSLKKKVFQDGFILLGYIFVEVLVLDFLVARIHDTAFYATAEMVATSWLLFLIFSSDEVNLITRTYFDNSFSLIEDAFSSNKTIPEQYGVPPDYINVNESIPSFFELLKKAKKLTDNVKSIASTPQKLGTAVNFIDIVDTTKGVKENTEEIQESFENLEQNLSFKCYNCNKPVQSNWKICPYCEKTLERKCIHCGQTLESGWSICPQCGQKLD